MPRPLVAVLLVLALLLQGLAPARAMPATADETPAAEQAQASMPCHGASAQPDEPVAPPTMNCCDAGADCGHCSAACMGTAALPVAMQTGDADLPQLTVSASAEGSPPMAPGAEQLRPPILSLR
jgi:hypothetical protein